MFEELRDYRPGDDIRTMDWKATARLRKAHVRVYSEERERPVLLVVDQRSSMYFGSARTTKATTAAELAALSAWRVTDAGDRVGAVIFGDDEIVEIRPQRSRQTVMRICSELVRFNQRLAADQAANAEMLNEAMRRARNLCAHDYLVVLITDYEGDDDETQRLATDLAAHNDVVASLIYDPLGISIDAERSLAATDGQRQVVISTHGSAAKRFQAAFQARCNQLLSRLRAIRIPILPICTHESVINQVRDALGGRR